VSLLTHLYEVLKALKNSASNLAGMEKLTGYVIVQWISDLLQAQLKVSLS
jgi:hypothetical protein